MKIVLHILLKDLRRHWREVALYVAAVCGFAWGQTHHGSSPVPEWSLPVLLVVLWLLVTVRVVQGECLVGDREFWTTRPYRWWQPMAAKALFLVLCLNLPLLAAQVYLLSAASLPLHAGLIPGLLWLQMMFALAFSVSAAALAAVTESLVQWVMAVVALGLFAMVVSWMPWSSLPVTLAGAEDEAGWTVSALVFAVLVFVLFWQYIERRVWPARIALAATVLAVPALMAAASSPWILSLAYPMGPAVPLHLAVAETGDPGERSHTRTPQFDGAARIDVPLRVSSIAPDELVVVEGFRFMLEGDRGWRWRSNWSQTQLNLESGESLSQLFFLIPAGQADAITSQHATAHVELALAVYRLTAPRRVETGLERFDLPGGIVCNWTGWNGFYQINMNPNCVVPLRLPDATVERVESADVTCRPRAGEPALPPGHHAIATQFDTGSAPADFDLNPVHGSALAPGLWTPAIPAVRDPQANLQATICRGTPFTVRIGTFTRRMKIDADLGSLGSEKVIEHPTVDIFQE